MINPLRAIPRQGLLLFLATCFLLVLAISGFAPHDRALWLQENILVVCAIALVALLEWRCPLSRVSLLLIFIFLCLHEIGAHFSYAEVPYDAWSKSLFGQSVNSLVGWERNHFDRIVHFLYGLLLAYPIREFYLRVVEVRGFWGYALPLDLTMSTSAFYELTEWLVAEWLGGDLGHAFLGAQGDQWDAQKDVALATLGALFAMAGTALFNWRFQRDFAREWQDSLRVKRRRPLGEEAF
ncbi:MAG TPA: DUF2238 domain-containing protein [Chthoniobacteraceae bacterium]